MKEKKQMVKDLTEIFDEEYERRNLITPHYTAYHLFEKGYRKQSAVAKEIFSEIERMMLEGRIGGVFAAKVINPVVFEKLKKKWGVEL